MLYDAAQLESVLLELVIVLALKNDVDLVNEFQRGNRETFDTLYVKHIQKVKGILLRLVKDEAVADELSQETFIKVFLNLRTFRNESKFTSWLYRIASNEALMYFRSKPYVYRKDMLYVEEEKLRQSGDEACPVAFKDIDGEFPDVTCRHEIRRLITDKFSNLCLKHKEVVAYRILDGLSTKETMDILQLPEEAVKQRLLVARRKLRRELKSYYEELYALGSSRFRQSHLTRMK